MLPLNYIYHISYKYISIDLAFPLKLHPLLCFRSFSFFSSAQSSWVDECFARQGTAMMLSTVISSRCGGQVSSVLTPLKNLLPLQNWNFRSLSFLVWPFGCEAVFFLCNPHLSNNPCKYSYKPSVTTKLLLHQNGRKPRNKSMKHQAQQAAGLTCWNFA